MSIPEPTIRVAVDRTNPGQFFACCGLLELASRLWPDAEGWFADGDFCIACDAKLEGLLAQLQRVQLTSSLGDDGLKRLGTLLSAEKSQLTSAEAEEKERLRAMWQVERVHVSEPFDFSLDWWWDDRSGVKLLKTWAAKQFVLEIARPILSAIRAMSWTSDSSYDCLNRTITLSGLPFYFDAANNTQSTARDNGFAPFVVKAPTAGSDRPLVELLTFFALQRFRPWRIEKSSLIRYTLWSQPLSVTVAAAAAAGRLQLPGDQSFAFLMLYRTKYMKAFLPAQHYTED